MGLNTELKDSLLVQIRVAQIVTNEIIGLHRFNF